MPVVGKLIGWPVSAKLRELNRSQWLSAQEIHALQSEKLVKLVHHAYATVPFYKRVFDEYGVSPDDIRSIDDHSKLPILTKEIIRANYPGSMVSSAFDIRKLTEKATSGSTGEPFKFVMSGEEKAYKWASLFRFWGWAGWQPGDKSVILSALPLGALKANRLGKALEQTFSGMRQLSTYLVDRETAIDYVKIIRDYSPAMVRGYASTLHHLAEIAQQEGIEAHVGAVCTTGETLFNFQRQLIEKVFNCRLYDAYGGDSAEIAGQCEHGNYHINAESCFVEIVDEDGKPVPPNTMGQVVITDLNSFSMPFIRYNLLDVAEHSASECPCGRHLPILKRIYGRLTDVGITPSGRAIIAHHFTFLMTKYEGAVLGFQVTQKAPDKFLVMLVKGQAFDARLAGVLRQGIQSQVSLRGHDIDRGRVTGTRIQRPPDNSHIRDLRRQTRDAVADPLLQGGRIIAEWNADLLNLYAHDNPGDPRPLQRTPGGECNRRRRQRQSRWRLPFSVVTAAPSCLSYGQFRAPHRRAGRSQWTGCWCQTRSPRP